MRIRLPNLPREQGNLILVALIISAIAGLTLASYLLLAQQQNLSIYRSQTWNSSMVVTEAGIEDGLQLINLYAGSLEPNDLYKWTNDAPGANWEQLSATVWHTHRIITNGVPPGAKPNSYDVWIYNTNNSPAVYAEGTVPWTHYFSSASPGLFAQAASTPPSWNPTTLTRKVLVNARFQPLFVVAMAAIDTIDLRGNTVQSDSFDSGDPNYSTNGGFYPFGNSAMTKDNGDICTDASIVDSLYIGNADIRGHVRTGPGTNTIYVLNGSVGSSSWVDSNTRGIEPGYSATDFNVSFDDVIIPTNGAAWMPTGVNKYTADGIIYDYHFSKGGRYLLNNLFGSILVDAPTNEVVSLSIGPGNVSLNGSEVIRLRPTGAKLVIYMWGTQFDLTGGAYIDNQSAKSYNFFLYGTPTCTEITFGGNGNFYGGVYAPEAAFTLGGGGSDTWDFIGASVTRTVFMNGKFRFHFDENLARIGPGRGYIPVAWRER